MHSISSGNRISINGGPRVRISRRQAPPFGDGRRGLIISSNQLFLGSQAGTSFATYMNGGIDPQGLRFALLFWDELAYPATPYVGPQHGQDEQFLIEAGVLIRPQYLATGTDASVAAEAPGGILNHLEKVEPGVWAIADGNLSFLCTAGFMQPKTGYSIELHRAIPVPDKEVPLNEILEFRLKRRDELLSLRMELDNFVAEVANDPSEAAINAYKQKIDRSCVELLRVCGEWQFPVRLGSISPNFEFSPYQALMASAATYKEVSAHLPATEAFIVAGVAAAGSQVKFKPKDFGWKGFKRPTPFRYVSQVHKEVF